MFCNTLIIEENFLQSPRRLSSSAEVGVCQSFFSLMKTLNPGAQTISTLILVKLIWSTDEQFSSLWLGKAYPYTDQVTTGFSTVSFSQLHIMVTLFFKKSRYWDKNRGKSTDCLRGPGVRLKSLLRYRFNYLKQNGIDGKEHPGSAVLQLMG